MKYVCLTMLLAIQVLPIQNVEAADWVSFEGLEEIPENVVIGFVDPNGNPRSIYNDAFVANGF